MLTVSARAIGRKKPIVADFSIPVPDGLAAGRSLLLRDVIEHVVRAEVAAFRDRQAERRLVRALTADQIEEGLTAGKVSAGGSDLDQAVDVDRAVAAALEAFGDGLFLVVVDDVELTDLNAVAPLAGSSRLTFIRLTMLAGG
jgi:ribosomal protein L20